MCLSMTHTLENMANKKADVDPHTHNLFPIFYCNSSSPILHEEGKEEYVLYCLCKGVPVQNEILKFAPILAAFTNHIEHHSDILISLSALLSCLIFHLKTFLHQTYIEFI